MSQTTHSTSVISKESTTLVPTRHPMSQKRRIKPTRESLMSMVIPWVAAKKRAGRGLAVGGCVWKLARESEDQPVDEKAMGRARGEQII